MKSHHSLLRTTPSRWKRDQIARLEGKETLQSLDRKNINSDPWWPLVEVQNKATFFTVSGSLLGGVRPLEDT